MAIRIAGFAQAVEFQVSSSINGVPCQGVATVHFAPAYDSATMAMTAALSQSSQWWLSQLAAAGRRAGVSA